MTDKLLAYLLKHLEGLPDATFYESELACISSSGFSALKKQKYLLFDQYDFEQETYCDKRGNERFVQKVNGRWIATSTEDSGISPVYLKEQDLNRYAFNVQPLLANIKTGNDLTKNVDAVTSRIWFIGEATVIQNNIGVFMAFVSDDEQARAELLGLKAKIGKMDGILVLCPSYVIKSQDLLSKLAGQNIVCLTFKEAFRKKDYAIDYSKARFGQASGQSSPKLTARQTADYTKYKYKCYDKLHISGTAPMKRSNSIIVNGHTIKMPDEAFRLIIELVVELKKRKGGWLTKKMEEGKYQIFDRVRKPLEGSLQDKDGKKFIENDGSKHYRISTHPDFVTYELRNLKKHADSVVSGFAKRMLKP
ncbi:MAG: hypothetical protein NTX59_10365 [Elusimicrobia bacterium]|nr:hypothetical protein [Elusimicrobiota bacterium]